MSYNKNKRQKSKNEKPFSLGLLLPIIALLAVIPLIMMMYTYNTNLGDFEWYTAVTQNSDFFLYYKMVWIIVSCCYMVLCALYLVFAEEQKLRWTKQLIPMAVYCVISLISAIASKYSYFSFHGIFEQFEPVWILMGYGIMVYYAFHIMHSESAVKRTMNWFLIGIAVMSAIGLSQVFKCDFFRTALGQKLITPSSYTGGELTFNFELGRPYITLYNPNYIGFYAALTIPVMLALFFAFKEIWKKAACGVLILAMVLILFASQSRAGILALVVSLFLMLLCMRRLFLKHWKLGIAGIIVVVVAFFAINAMNGNVLLSRMQNMFSSEEEYYTLKEIQTNDDDVTVVYQTQERSQETGDELSEEDQLVFHVTQDESGSDVFDLQDGTGKAVDFYLSEDGVNYAISDARFPFTFASVRDDSFNGFRVTIDGYEWYLSNLMKDGDSTYYCRGGSGAMMKLATITESVSYLDKHYRLANMRGYIWDRTIPLLKKYFFLGSGPDTFIIAFPNSDLVGLYNSGHVNEIITKPHCMYLQVGVQTGVISLIALLVFFGWYLIDSLHLYWRCNYNQYLPLVGVGILAAVIGYLILALTNDSCITISPIFYTLLGIGLGINHKIRTELAEVCIIPKKVKQSSKDDAEKKTAEK
jgi:O-antigen ligase